MSLKTPIDRAYSHIVSFSLSLKFLLCFFFTYRHCIIKEKNVTKKYLSYCEVNDHPLKAMTVTMIPRKLIKGGSQTSSTLSLVLDGVCDPLTMFAKNSEVIDPLSKMASEYVNVSVL